MTDVEGYKFSVQVLISKALIYSSINTGLRGGTGWRLKSNVVALTNAKFNTSERSSRRRDFLCFFPYIYFSNLAPAVKKNEHLMHCII